MFIFLRFHCDNNNNNITLKFLAALTFESDSSSKSIQAQTLILLSKNMFIFCYFISPFFIVKFVCELHRRTVEYTGDVFCFHAAPGKSTSHCSLLSISSHYLPDASVAVSL